MQHSLKMIALLALIGAGNAQAQDIEKGHELVHENCVSCHHNEVYTRADRRVTSLAGLHKQVRRCEQNLGLTWFDEDIHNVSGYLNNKYYKFENK